MILRLLLLQAALVMAALEWAEEHPQQFCELAQKFGESLTGTIPGGQRQ